MPMTPIVLPPTIEDASHLLGEDRPRIGDFQGVLGSGITDVLGEAFHD